MLGNLFYAPNQRKGISQKKTQSLFGSDYRLVTRNLISCSE